MTVIHTIEDFVRILDERPEWQDALRARMLTRELLALPQVVAELAISTNRRLAALETTLAEFMASTERRFTALEKGQARMENDIATLQERQARMENDITALKEGQARLEEGQARISHDVSILTHDVSILKAAHARNGALRITRRIARITNCRQIRLLEGGEILDWLSAADTAGIPQNELDSFEDADIIIEAERRDTSEIHYIAVEVSYTAGQRDVERAIRNAAFLTRFTGQPAHAAVVGRRARAAIMPLIESGEVYWAELGPEDLETD